MAEFKCADDEIRGIKRHDLWRWEAELDALRAALWDEGKEQSSFVLTSIVGELQVLACPDNDV